LQEKLSNKFKNGHEKVPKPKFSRPFFGFIEQFYFQNDVFELQEVFSEHGIRVFLENERWKFSGISYFTDLRQTREAKKITKTVLRILWFSENILLTLSGATQLGHFRGFWNIH
jgi:hypothetical protein